ncbi:MAG: hypothetical protein P8X42_15140 [Calditrichaceae bacterium]
MRLIYIFTSPAQGQNRIAIYHFAAEKHTHNKTAAQYNSHLKFIFIHHPRSDIEGVLPAIENINFTQYDVTMLGGDLTWTTSEDTATMAYCDSIFDLGSPNTLWSLGSHDVQREDSGIIKSFTGRESYYAYNRDGITFLVLDTELDANGSSGTFIKGEQLQMVKKCCYCVDFNYIYRY